MKTILVPVERHDLIRPTVETACLLGSAFDSHIVGFALTPALSPFMATDAIGGAVLYDAVTTANDQTAEESRRAFEEVMVAKGVPRTSVGDGVSWGWTENSLVGDGYVGNYGRVFDITVVGRPGAAAGQPRMATLESALFESGRPVLMVPPAAPARIGETVVIAWNRSTETARAVAFAMPILKKARRTVVLSVEGGSVPGPTGEQVVHYLARHGVECETQDVKSEAGHSGPDILDATAKLGGDLIVKGAFTQSRLRQMIFGGATRHLIAEANLPVLLAH